MNVTHPNQPLGTATLTEADPKELPLWWERNKTREGEYPKKAFLYTYTGPGQEVPSYGPKTFIVFDKGRWWMYFDTDLAFERATPEEVAYDIIEMDIKDLTSLEIEKLP